jgi:hypothetical protein
MPLAGYRAELAAYLALRRVVPLDEATVNGRTIVLFGEDELADAQVGYGVDPDGDDLSTDAPGGWQPAWLVVAQEEESGTPLAIDLALDGFPVLALADEDGRWEPDLAAESFPRFVRALETAAAAGEPLDEDARERVLAEIYRDNPSASLVFWESLLEED